MKCMPCLAVFSLILIGPFAGLYAADSPPAKVSDDARKLIDQIGQNYLALKSLDLQGTYSADLQVDGSAAEHHSADFSDSYLAPNYFRHEMKDDVLIGSTGQKLYAYWPQRTAYLETDAPKDRVSSSDLPRDINELLEAQDPSLILALSKAPADELLRDVVEATLDKPAADDQPQVIHLVNKDGSKTALAIDSQSHLLRQATIDLSTPLQKRRSDLAKAVVTIDYKTTRTDSAAKQDAFAWSAPPGARDAAQMAAAHPQDAVEASALEGKDAPTFKLTSLDGKEISLSDLKGHVVILDFWATWCGPCKMSLPHLQKTYEAGKDKGLKVFAVDQQEEQADVQKFVKQTTLTVPVLLDSDGKVGQQYGVEGIPQTVVIGKDGKVKKVFVGFNPDSSPAELQRVVDEEISAK